MARAPTDLRSLARSYTELSLRTLAGIAQHSENDGARVSACGLLLDRGWGRVRAAEGDDGEGSIQITIRHILEGSNQPAPARPAIEHAQVRDDESEP